MTYSLYTDGCHYTHLNAAGIGGYLLDTTGKKLWEFSEQLSQDKILHQHEIYALEYGLKECIKNGIKDLNCFLDAKSIAETLNVKDESLLNAIVQKEKTLKIIFPLLKEFNNLNFYYLPRNENKLADKLSRSQLFKNIPNRSQIVDGAFQTPNLLCTQQFSLSQKKDFAKLKQDVKNHYLFKLTQSKEGFKLKVYEIEKTPEIKVLNAKSYKLDKNWISHHVDIVNEVLKNSPSEEIGLIFWPKMNDIGNILRGIQPITKKTKDPLEKFADIATKFSKIILHDEEIFLRTVLPKEFKEIPTIENKPLTLVQQEAFLIENLSIISQKDYKLGSNHKVENFLKLGPKKLEDVTEIQKKNFSEILKVKIKQDDDERRKNKEIITSRDKNNVLIKIAELKKELEEKGIKIKIQNNN